MSKNIERYADLLVRIGINIQENQVLVINSPIDCAEFARIVSIKAYEAGAREVVMRWNDEKSTKIRYEMANDEVFDEFPNWAKQQMNELAEKDAAFLSIAASDPELMKDVDPKKISRQNKAGSIALEAYRTRLMSNKNVWCVASIPTEAWAKKVFPNDSTENAMEKLWEAIFKAVRADKDDPVKAWVQHQNDLDSRLKFLNENKFKSLRFKNSLGTDITTELPKDHVWVGGGSEAPKGYTFVANMPTEEVFTMPKLDGVNGKVVSSIPLNYNGNLIDDFTLTFKDGLVVDYTAKKGENSLKELLNTDDGAKRLGEVALVPYDSPISNQNILFYNTLFDENASCHFALGKAYSSCVKGGDDMSKEELKEVGANDSLTHVDFMIGTEDLEIMGIKEDGTETLVFDKGNFVQFS
ncbi:aminopeptidase [Proteinivorax hydrogeniformans]|uniref:Aminopeptidase n=1 Tax=Proteinivorax hydrogeniformans TaxID=1826727 RepID=A0AAU8HUR3_9FIRM